MRLKVVAVAPPSLSNSVTCWKCKQDTGSLKFCSHCQALQDTPTSALSYFEVLELPESLALDEAHLRERFYSLSKKLHPDCFANRPQPEPAYALRWTTALNRAYQTLRDRTERSLYLLQKYATGAPAKDQVPLDLAESYFELQDLLTDGNAEPMLEFKAKLETEWEKNHADWKFLATAWDAEGHSEKTIEKLRTQMNRERYLKSMLNDIERRLSQ